MSVHKRKGGRIYYADFVHCGKQFVRSTGTANRRQALRAEKKLRALAASGKLQTPSPEQRRRAIARSLRILTVKQRQRVKARETADRRKRDPKARQEWIDSIKKGQSEPAAKSTMDEARERTRKNPAYRKKKSRSQKRIWKRRGHRTRVSRSMTEKWNDQEFRDRNLAGRDAAAASRLAQKGVALPSIARPTRKRTPKAGEKKTEFLIARRVDEVLGPGPRSKNAIVAARLAVCRELSSADGARHFEYDTVAQYHQRYLRSRADAGVMTQGSPEPRTKH